ncbi:thiol-disulfide oxidoreductase DCC family protein [Bacteroidota bacterium]
MYKKENPLIIFDGICNLCNSTIEFVIKEDKKKIFRFSSMQSVYAKDVLLNFRLNIKADNSVILIDKGKVYTKSTAIIRILKKLGFYYRVFAYLMFIIPAPLRNLLYNFISYNRYKWFGKRKNCTVPQKELEDRFYQ